jgi:hypothetical protein
MSKELTFQKSSVIQYGSAILFYRFDKHLNGYFINGVLTSGTKESKLDFYQIWKYFLNEVVRDKDVFCSFVSEQNVDFFKDHTKYYDEINGMKVYKVDNVFIKTISSYYKAAINQDVVL